MAPSSAFTQIKLLAWKSMVEKKRSVLKMVTQVALPIGVVFFLIVIYETMAGKSYDGEMEKYFAPLGFVCLVPFVTTTVASEKSTRLLESMKMMGLSELAYWVALLLTEGVLYGGVVGFIVAVVARVPNAWDADLGLFNNGNFGEVWLAVWLYAVAAVPFGVFLSVFFDKPQTAGQVAFVVSLGCSILTWVYDLSELGDGAQLAAALLPPYGFGVLVESFAKDFDGASYASVAGVLAASVPLYIALGWYLAGVWPSAFGVRKPWYFPLRACASCCRRAEPALLARRASGGSPLEAGEDFEPMPATNEWAERLSVRVRGLRKTFAGANGEVVAVDDLSVDLFEGQCFALLGHNGAGKTTTINMLTGLFAPDSSHGGETTVYGHSIAGDMEGVRGVLGVCPQHDVLIPALTTAEHLLFFAALKGASRAEAERETEQLLAEFHLLERRRHFGSALSGGMRRKLSTAIALAGGSKFVVLDEPSSGMDPMARRQLWETLRRAMARGGRTLLLTTHYMDEADVLGDRIGIMDHGIMRTVGSSGFLKKRFGCGYVLSCVKQAEDTPPERAIAYVKEAMPLAKHNARESYGKELEFVLPFDSVSSFGAFFAGLDGQLEALGLAEYGVSITTMEDVFLRVGAAGRKEVKDLVRRRSSSVGGEREAKEASRAVKFGVEGQQQQRASLWDQVAVMVKKKIWTTQHDIRALPMLALPPALTLAFFALNEQGLLNSDEKVGDGMTSYFCMASFLFLPGLVAEQLVRERNLKLRHTLTVMGCRQLAYFGGMLLGDLLFWALMTVLNWAIIIGFSEARFLRWGGVLLLLPVFGVQLIGFSYCVSFLYKRPSFAIIFTPGLLLLLILGPMIVLGIFQLLFVAVSGDPMGSDTSFGLMMYTVMLFCPLGAFGTGMFRCVIETSGTLDWVIPPFWLIMMVMAAQGTLFFYLAVKWDAESIRAMPVKWEAGAAVEAKRAQMSEDVKREAAAVEATEPSAVALQLKQVRKVYPARGPTPVTEAVKGVSLQVKKGELFCLLGPNGAGKSTTLNMLLRSVVPTTGAASICGHSVLSDFEEGALQLGVVPQDNNLWSLLSCERHLRLFAQLRGVPAAAVDAVVESTLKHMELTEKRGTLAGRLSGGMQRRLCTAIALIGEPEVVLLDEPSAGLDPVSRRNLWDVILDTMQERAVILTTHSMEEAEALSQRIGIMVEGSLQCIGSAQQLKAELGSDFEVVLRLSPAAAAAAAADADAPANGAAGEAGPQDAVAVAGSASSGGGSSGGGGGTNGAGAVPARVREFIRELYPNAKLVSVQGNVVVYDVRKEEMRIGPSFAAFEGQKDAVGILDYSISQPTLEQVFIRTVEANTTRKPPPGDVADGDGASSRFRRHHSRLASKGSESFATAERFRVTIPAGLSPGSTFLVQTPKGGKFNVTVPSGKAPGDSLMVTVPQPSVNAAASPRNQTAASAPAAVVLEMGDQNAPADRWGRLK